jgi:hypothetical protein
MGRVVYGKQNETEICPCDYLPWSSRSFDVLGGALNDRFIRFGGHLLAGGHCKCLLLTQSGHIPQTATHRCPMVQLQPGKGEL